MTGKAIDVRPVASDHEIGRVLDLAKAIWTDHYSPILGRDQVAYMLETYHSRSAIKSEITDKGVSYFLIRNDGRDVGYFAFRIDAQGLFLSKIYILASERGRGLAKRALAYLRDQAIRDGAARIRLTVNKKNTGSISAYEKIGFLKTGEVLADIGNGFVMDDFTMAWDL
jgi:ribosomal protein S18 acetylase RimI-like enzyme